MQHAADQRALSLRWNVRLWHGAELLERLERKGLVSRDRTLFVHTFTAAADRDDLIARRLRALADKLCGGSLAPILLIWREPQPHAEGTAGVA